MSGPLYGCSNIGCAEECSYPADMLRVYEGKPYCGGCWDYAPLAYAPGIDPDDEDVEPLRWYELEPFVPEHERRISELEAENQRLREAAQAVCDQRGSYALWAISGLSTRRTIDKLAALLQESDE